MIYDIIFFGYSMISYNIILHFMTFYDILCFYMFYFSVLGWVQDVTMPCILEPQQTMLKKLRKLGMPLQD